MSTTLEPIKWYWAYESSSTGTHYIFDTHEKAIQHAINNGEYEECCGKDSCMEKDEALFFECDEDDVKEYNDCVYIN